MWHRLLIAGSHALVAIAFFNTAVFNAARAADDQPAERAIVAVEVSIVIQRPAAEVFAFVSNAENDIHWRSEVVSMKNLTPAPQGVGSRTVEVAKVLGKQLETTTEIVEFVPDVRMARRSLSGQTPVSTARSVATVEAGTRFTYRLRADVTDVATFRLLRPIVQWWTQRKVEGYMRTLKQFMETPVVPA